MHGSTDSRPHRRLRARAAVLSVAIALLLGGGIAVGGAVPAAESTPVVHRGMVAEMDRIFADTNAMRASAGLAPLRRNAQLDYVATNWSGYEAQQNVLMHNPNLASEIAPGWSLAGENVAWGYTPQSVAAKWWASPGHRVNMVGSFTDVGIGMYRDSNGTPYYSQVFARY